VRNGFAFTRLGLNLFELKFQLTRRQALGVFLKRIIDPTGLFVANGKQGKCEHNASVDKVRAQICAAFLDKFGASL
jgi:RPA family protein